MSSRPFRVAMLVVDDRSNPLVGTPSLGSAPTALLEGFADLGPDQVEVHVVTCLKQSGVLPCKLAPNVWYHPLRVPGWAFLRTLHLGPALTVRRFLREQIKPDIVHSQGIEWWCGMAGALSGYPAVLTIHGNIRAILANSTLRPRTFWRLQAALGDFAIRRHAGVICISEHIRKAIAPAARNTWLIPNALRKEFLQEQDLEAKRSARPSLLVVGTITENKRPLEILEVLFALHADGVEFKVAFIGQLGKEGRYANRFASRLEEASQLGFARHLEHLNADALCKKMNSAHGLIHFPMEEAFGLVVAEAMSQGMPIFSNGVGGLVELCGGHSRCNLFQKDDFTGLSHSLKHWLQAAKQHHGLSEKRFCIEPYKPRNVANLTLLAYKDVASLTANCTN